MGHDLMSRLRHRGPVYHCEAERGSKQSETFKVMDRRLLKAIINPAMIAQLCAMPAR